MNPHKTGLDDIKKKDRKKKEIAIDVGKLKLCLLNQCQTTGIKAFALLATVMNIFLDPIRFSSGKIIRVKLSKEKEEKNGVLDVPYVYKM